MIGGEEGGRAWRREWYGEEDGGGGGKWAGKGLDSEKKRGNAIGGWCGAELSLILLCRPVSITKENAFRGLVMRFVPCAASLALALAVCRPLPSLSLNVNASPSFPGEIDCIHVLYHFKEIGSECIDARGWPSSSQCPMESCNYKCSISFDIITLPALIVFK